MGSNFFFKWGQYKIYLKKYFFFKVVGSADPLPLSCLRPVRLTNASFVIGVWDLFISFFTLIKWNEKLRRCVMENILHNNNNNAHVYGNSFVDIYMKFFNTAGLKKNKRWPFTPSLVTPSCTAARSKDSKTRVVYIRRRPTLPWMLYYRNCWFHLWLCSSYLSEL